MKYPNRVIKLGEKDKNIVKAIQKQINTIGIAKLKEDGDFGKITESAIKLFQSISLDSKGMPLLADGKIGSITWHALFNTNTQNNSLTTALLSNVLDIAKGEIGKMEIPQGSNWGVHVQKYLKSVGINFAAPWCMAFVYWCFDEASRKLGKTNPMVKTGGCLRQWNETKAKKITATSARNNPSLIIPGSVFIIDHGSGLGHTGIVVSLKNGYLKTIEGNTNLSRSREGIGVFELNSRKITSINKGFIIFE